MSAELQEKQMELTGPGRRLMEARNALNLSRDDVARQLKLKVKTVIAIEEDRVDELPAPMYVIGYLRNYAKLLKIPHEPVVEAFEQLRIEPPPFISEVVKPKSKGTAEKLVKWGSIVIAIVLFAGFISWLLKQDFEFGLNNPVVNENTATENIVVPEIPAEPATQDIIEELPGISPQQEVAGENPAEVQSKTIAATPAAKETSIVLTLKEDCWVEIVDANGEQLVYDLLKGDQSYTYQGMMPFDIFFGNAAVVAMTVNGEPYDVKPHIRGKLARFTMTATTAPE